MKIVTILGSPRKKGNTAKVLELFENNLVSQGHEIDRINITSYNLKGCLGCDKCKKVVDVPGCIQKDDMMALFDRMISADAIVYGTPLYWWGFTAQLKTLIDRQYCLIKNDETPEYKSFLKGKREALLVTCADLIEDNADLIPVMFERKCSYTASKAVGKYILPSCTSPDEMVEAAKEIAGKMAQEILGTHL